MSLHRRLHRLEADVVNLPPLALLGYLERLERSAQRRLLTKLSDEQIITLYRLFVERHAAETGVSYEQAEQDLFDPYRRDATMSRSFEKLRPRAQKQRRLFSS